MSTHPRRTELAVTALAASLVTLGLVTAYNSRQKRDRTKSLKEDALHSFPSSKHEYRPAGDSESPETITKLPNTQKNAFSEELVREQLARNYAFFGDEGMAKVRSGKVVVVGCGGVGSWAAVMLVRSGVSKIRLIDFDYVTLSSLNRHATACLEDVGSPKVICIEKVLRSISKVVEVDSHVAIWRKEDGGALLEGADWVIDAIDNITTKVDLLKYCHSNKIKVFSSMGAGAKSDPTRVHISDISYTVYDPLARSVRRRLRLQGVSSGIPVVYSSEVPSEVKLLPLPEDEFQKGPVKELGVFDDFRVRILPVLGPLPSIFGLHIATYILCELAGKPINNPLPINNRKKLYERLLRDLLHSESKLVGRQLNKLPLDDDDVGLIFEDLHRGRSVIPPHPVPSRPTLVRWNPLQPLTVENCVVMDHKEAQKHVEQCYALHKPYVTPPGKLWGEEVAKVVKRRAKEASLQREWVM